MKFPMSALFLSLAFVTALPTQAYMMGKLTSDKLVSSKPTHVVVAGTAHEAGMLFQQAAITKALKYRELYPEDQIVFLSQHEGEYENNSTWLKKRGVEVLVQNKKDLTTERFVDHLKEFSQIRTIDIFSHSAASYGIQLSSITRGKIGPNDKKIAELKGRFTADAMITLNGCNSGFYVAPAWSKTLGVPVSGSLTSTDFQALHTDNNYYLNNPESMPKDIPLAVANTIAYENAPNCKLGLCIRMKPVNGPYNGYWGSYYEGGLPFYKIFCNGTTDEKCNKAYQTMAKHFISIKNLKTDTSFEAYKVVVQDILCPLSANKPWREECVKALNAVEADQSLATYNPFRGKQLQCDNKGCSFELDCPMFKKECKLINTHEGAATTITDEYKRYLSAF